MLSAFFVLFISSQLSAEYNVEIAFPSLSFEDPVGIYHANDGSNRLFVIEQPGKIIVFNNDASTSDAEVFLDIRSIVDQGGGYTEEGLLGLAFHPNYSENGYFYVNYTEHNPRRNVIARYSVDPDDPNEADYFSSEIILEVNQPYTNHNGGQLGFGPDGYLYIMGRTDDIINVAGHRLSTGGMEEVLAAHPDVAECAVIGVKDQLKGQIPLGFLLLKAGAEKSKEEIKTVLDVLTDEREKLITQFGNVDKGIDEIIKRNNYEHVKVDYIPQEVIDGGGDCPIGERSDTPPAPAPAHIDGGVEGGVDGSVDGSGNVLKELEQKDEKVKIINGAAEDGSPGTFMSKLDKFFLFFVLINY